MLESFSLKMCWGKQVLQIEEKCFQLKSLVIESYDFSENSLIIMDPKLRYLKYASRLVTFGLYVGRYIQVADIDLGCDEDEFVEHGYVIHHFLHDLYSVKLLTVCYYILHVIPSEEKPLYIKPFLNVVHLTLRTSLHDNEF